MKAKITIKQTFTVELDGKPVSGEFHIESDWEGFVKLESNSPMETIIIERPDRAVNQYDLIPKMLGGNSPNGKEITFTAEVVRGPRDLRISPKIATTKR